MLRYLRSRFPIRREIVWFAEGRFDPGLFAAAVTYFRFHGLDIPREACVSDEQVWTLLLDLEGTEDRLRRGLTETVRYEVRRAEREGVTVRERPHDDATIERFCADYATFSRAKGWKSGLAPATLHQLTANWTLYSASEGERWLADLLLIHDDQRIRQWVAANARATTDRALVGYASKAVVWRSIVDAKARGMRVYDFGGVVIDPADPRSGVTAFKASFGGTRHVERNTLVVARPLLRAAVRAALGARARVSG